MAASKSPADKASKKGFTSLKDMFDGGGMGGSGASYSSLSNEDYKRAGGKDYQEGMRRGGWTEFDQQGQGRTLRGPQAMMANPFFGGLLGLATGGASGAMMGLGGTMVRNDIRQKGGLGGLLGKQGGVAQQAAIAPILAPATSMRPQPRPQMMSSQAMPQDFYGLSGNPAMQAPLSSMSGAPQVDPTAPAMPQPDVSGMSTEDIGTILAGGTAAVAGNAALRAALMYELSRRGAGGMPPVARPQPLMIAQRPIPYTPPTSSVVPRGGMRVGAPAFTGGSMNLRPSTGGGGAGMFSIDGRMPPQFLE